MFGYRLSYRYKRLRVRWRQWKQSIDETIVPKNHKTTTFQDKAIRLWKLTLRDKNSKLAFNNFSVRQIENDNLLLVFQHNSSGDSVMTIIDINKAGKNLYELNIPLNYSEHVTDLFDSEMDKRMKSVQTTKSSIIETDLDKLLKTQEDNLKK